MPPNSESVENSNMKFFMERFSGGILISPMVAVLNYGHQPLEKEKREQRNRLFKGMKQFYYVSNYIASPEHNTIYLMEENDKVYIDELIPKDPPILMSLKDINYFDYYSLLYKAQYYFPEPFKKLVDSPNTINSLTANHSVQQSLNELIFWMEFWKFGGVHYFDKVIFMSNSFFCEDEEWFAKQIQEDNWFIHDVNHNEHAKSVWSCKKDIFDELIDQLQYSAANHWSNFHSGDRFNHDSETFKYKLFFEEFKLKPVLPHGMAKRGIQLPKNGHPIRIEIGCKKWLHGHY